MQTNKIAEFGWLRDSSGSWSAWRNVRERHSGCSTHWNEKRPTGTEQICSIKSADGRMATDRRWIFEAELATNKTMTNSTG